MRELRLAEDVSRIPACLLRVGSELWPPSVDKSLSDNASSCFPSCIDRLPGHGVVIVSHSLDSDLSFASFLFLRLLTRSDPTATKVTVHNCCQIEICSYHRMHLMASHRFGSQTAQLLVCEAFKWGVPSMSKYVIVMNCVWFWSRWQSHMLGHIAEPLFDEIHVFPGGGQLGSLAHTSWVV